MHDNVHTRNGRVGVLITLVALLVLAMGVAVLYPVLKLAGGTESGLFRALPLLTVLGFQFALCFYACQRSERMLQKADHDAAPDTTSLLEHCAS